MSASYEAKARDVLFGKQSLSSLHAFQVMVQRLKSRRAKPEGFYTLPVRGKFGAFNTYFFSLGGFRIAAKLEAKRFPREYLPFVLNGNSVFRGLYVKLEDTPEFDAMAEMIAAHERRGDPSPTGRLKPPRPRAR